MMKRRGITLVVVSLMLGLAAAWGANEWVRARLYEADTGSDMERVVAAAIEIPYGTKLEERHLRMIELPPDGVPDAAATSYDAALGKVATIDIQRGEIVLQNRLADHTGGSTLAALVKASMRAITVRVDDVVGVAGFLLPGNFVDVVASRMDRKTGRATTETVLRNLKVLAVDQTASTNANEPVIVRAVTLEVTPPQSETLVKAREEGTIQLTLRNPHEVQIAQAPPRAVPKPVAPPPAPKTRWQPSSTEVQIIRGTKLDKTRARL